MRLRATKETTVKTTAIEIESYNDNDLLDITSAELRGYEGV